MFMVLLPPSVYILGLEISFFSLPCLSHAPAQYQPTIPMGMDLYLYSFNFKLNKSSIFSLKQLHTVTV